MSQHMQLTLPGLTNLWNNHLSTEERLLLQARLQSVIDEFYRLKFGNFQMNFDQVNALLNSTINTNLPDGSNLSDGISNPGDGSSNQADGKYEEEAKQD